MLPESFGNLNNLEELNLSSNHLGLLPISFGNLSELKKMNLDKNSLISIPKEVSNLKNLQIVIKFTLCLLSPYGQTISLFLEIQAEIFSNDILYNKSNPSRLCS